MNHMELIQISNYQFGFHDPDQSVFRAHKGLDRETVEQISAMKGEPAWMRDIRLKAFDIFAKTDASLGRQCGQDELQ